MPKCPFIISEYDWGYMIKYITFILLFSTGLALHAQKELVVYKGAKMKRLELPLNLPYVFVLKNKHTIQGKITQLLDSAVIVNLHDTVYLAEVKKIRTPMKQHSTIFFGELFFKGGLFLVLADPVNNLITNDKPYFKPMGITGAILAPIGYLMIAASNKTIRINRRTVLRIAQFE